MTKPTFSSCFSKLIVCCCRFRLSLLGPFFFVLSSSCVAVPVYLPSDLTTNINIAESGITPLNTLILFFFFLLTAHLGFFAAHYNYNRELNFIIKVNLFLESLLGLVSLVLSFWLILFSRFIVTSLSIFRRNMCNDSFFN
jgi:hypothetical protein